MKYGKDSPKTNRLSQKLWTVAATHLKQCSFRIQTAAMSASFYRSILFITIIALSACTAGFDREKRKGEILALLQQERKAHFDRDVSLFISEFADSMISVNRGLVLTATPKERRARIQGYFNSVEFVKWDDVHPPQIRFSDDGSLAYAIVQKQVILLRTDSLNNKITDTSDYAWVSIYRRTGTGWKVECNASTNK